jgi:hypothetical protein
MGIAWGNIKNGHMRLKHSSCLGSSAAWASKRVLGHPAKLDMFQWVRGNPRGAASKRGAHSRLVAEVTWGRGGAGIRALVRPDLTKERWNASDGGNFRGDGLGFGDVREGTEGGGRRGVGWRERQ